MDVGSLRRSDGGALPTEPQPGRRDVRIVQLLALPGVIATVLYVPAIDLAAPCRHSGRVIEGAIDALLATMTVCLLVSLLIWPLTLARCARIRPRLNPGTVILVLVSLAPALVFAVLLVAMTLGYR